MTPDDRPDPRWEAATWEGSRRAQLRESLSLTVRERLQALEGLWEASEWLVEAGERARRAATRTDGAPRDS
jgi:hypothetical protein